MLPTLPWNSHFFNLFLLCIPEWAQKDFYMYPSSLHNLQRSRPQGWVGKKNGPWTLSYFSVSSHWILFQSSWHRAFSPSLCLCLHIIPLALIPITTLAWSNDSLDTRYPIFSFLHHLNVKLIILPLTSLNFLITCWLWVNIVYQFFKII